MLLNIDPNLFSYATEKNIYDYSPSGIMNIILHAKQNLISESNITKYQALSEIIKNSYIPEQIDNDDDLDIQKQDNIDNQQIDDDNEADDETNITQDNNIDTVQKTNR